MNEKVVALALSHNENITWHWCFMRVGELTVKSRNTGTHIGELYYENGHYEIGPAVQVRDWVFFLERDKTHADSKWTLGGFRGMHHYKFLVMPDTKSKMTRYNTFLHMVITKFVRILHPEVFGNETVAPDAEIPFATVLLSNAESIQRQAATLTAGQELRGGGHGRKDTEPMSFRFAK